MKRTITFLSIFLLCAGLFSCEPTETNPTPKPTPEKPTPDPQPDPNPDPDPDPDPTPEEGTIIYYDNLDKQDVSTPVYFDQGSNYWNMEGTGIDNITYASSYASIRSDYSSQGYPGASGSNGIHYNKENSSISVKNIELPENERTFKLTIGLYNPGGAVTPNQTFIICVTDGNKNVALNYTVTAYGKWYLATSTFSVEPADISHISITVQSLTSKGRSDDLRLATTTDSPSQVLDFNNSDTPQPIIREWVEKPAALIDNSDYKYITHYASTYKSKKYVRNYSACYDTGRHNPIWVAFPCHAIYNEGGTTRPSKDPWRPDPEMTDEEQSIIYADDWDNWPNHSTRYWTYGPNSTKFVKGHLMGSADRGCGNSNQLLDLNTQTFYPTNVAPEFYQTWNGGSNYNDSHWGMIERLRQDKWVCSDTLYVVIGCAYEHDDWILYDNSMGSKRYNPSKACTVPSARYLLALRTKKGNSGKHIEDCSADEIMAIGFWFPQSYDGSYSLPALKDYIFSIDQLEEKLNNEFDFFPTAPSSVKSTFNISEWPGLSAIAN